MFVLILNHFFSSVETLLTLSGNLSNFKNYLKILKKSPENFQKSKNLKNTRLPKKNPKIFQNPKYKKKIQKNDLKKNFEKH